MIWLTWRQFRAQSVVGAVVLVVAVLASVLAGRAFAEMWTNSGAAACPATGDCPALDSFLSEANKSWASAVYGFGAALLYLVPPLVGVFWGAPLVARELEAGTHRLVWNQSVTRVRWLGTKLAILGVASMAFAGLLSLATTLAAQRLDETGYNRLEPVLFGARGIVPVAYAAFAFVLGVVVGMVFRRTVPAMATTLAVYAGLGAAMAMGLRGHLLPATHTQLPLNTGDISSMGISQDGVMRVEAGVDLPGAWVLQNTTVTSTGQEFTGPANTQVCGRDGSPKDCIGWLSSLGLKQDVVYQPAGRFWPLQWAEAGVFLALAALLVAFGFWWLRRRSN